MSQPLTRADLDSAGCQAPGCTHDAHDSPLSLHGRCHPGAPVDAAYKEGVLRIQCHVCYAPIVAIAVAEGPP